MQVKQQRLNWFWGLLCCVIAVSIAGCCTDLVTGESYFCLVDVSEEQEIEMGRAYAVDFSAQSGGSYPDPELQKYLGDIVLDMARKSHRPDLPWNFTVLNTSQVNAFALPGGEVFVTRGLLAQLDSEAQFAHLMGHEIGHVTHRHAVRGQNRAVFFQLALALAGLADQHLLDPDSPPIISGVTSGVGQLTMLHYSRDQELQCDSRGVDYAIAAGYDARESRKTFELFQEMKAATGKQQGLVEELLATHPPDDKRIDEIAAYIDANYATTNFDSLEVSRPRWGPQLTRVQHAQKSYEKLDEALALIEKARTDKQQAPLDRAEELVRQGAAALTGHAPFPAALGLIALERHDDSEARLQLNRACRLDPNYFQARYYRGLLHLRRSEYPEAHTDMQAAQKLFPSHPLPYFHLGAIAENEGAPKKAVEWYEAAMQRAGEDSTVYKQAAERLQDLKGSGQAAPQAKV